MTGTKKTNYVNNQRSAPRDSDVHSGQPLRHFDFETMQSLITPGLEAIETMRAKKGVMVIGNSNAGKTTGICYLQGRKMKRAFHEGRMVVMLEEPDEKAPKIGINLEPETLYPQAYVIPGEHLIFCDFPGFLETRNDESAVITSVTTELAVKSASEIASICVVIAYPELTENNAQGITELAKTLSKILLDADSVKPSIFFLINKVPEYITHEHIVQNLTELKALYEKKVQAQKGRWARLSQFIYGGGSNNAADVKTMEEARDLAGKLEIFERMLENTGNIILINPMDKGQSRSVIFDKVKAAPPVPKEAFNFNTFCPERVEFDKTLQHFTRVAIGKLKQAMTLPARLIWHDSEIAGYNEQLNTYEGMINNFDEQGDTTVLQTVKIKQTIAVYREMKAATLRDINIVRKEIAGIEAAIQDEERAKVVLCTGEPTKHLEVRHLGNDGFFLNIFSYEATDTVLSHKGLPFVKVVTKNPGNGVFVAGSEKMNKEKGTYEIRYKATKFQKAEAVVEIYISPELANAESIASHDDEIASQQLILDEATTRLAALEKVVEDKTASILELERDDAAAAESMKERLASLKRTHDETLPAQIKVAQDKKRNVQRLLEELRKQLETEANPMSVIADLLKKFDLLEEDGLYREFVSALEKFYRNEKQEADEQEVRECPDEFLCSLTGKRMTDPVYNKGCLHLFERTAIHEYIKTRQAAKSSEHEAPCCPATNCRAEMSQNTIEDNGRLKERIEANLALERAKLALLGGRSTGLDYDARTTVMTELERLESELQKRVADLESQLRHSLNSLTRTKQQKADLTAEITALNDCVAFRGTVSDSHFYFADGSQQAHQDESVGFTLFETKRPQVVSCLILQKNQVATREALAFDIVECLSADEWETPPAVATTALARVREAREQVAVKLCSLMVSVEGYGIERANYRLTEEDLEFWSQIETAIKEVSHPQPIRAKVQAAVKNLVDAYIAEKKNLLSKCSQVSVFQDYVNQGLGGTLALRRAGIKFMAKEYQKNIYIWKTCDDANEDIGEDEPQGLTLIDSQVVGESKPELHIVQLEGNQFQVLKLVKRLPVIFPPRTAQTDFFAKRRAEAEAASSSVEISSSTPGLSHDRSTAD